MNDGSSKILIGDTKFFAIESAITEAANDFNVLGSGYFALHIHGHCFGVREPDATLLSYAYGEIGRRLAGRGQHTAPFAAEPSGSAIIDAIGEAIYNPNPTAFNFFGLSTEEFSARIYSSHCQWHRGYGEAFDDGSGVLHFDIGDSVRLIADKPPKNVQNWHHDPATFTEVWLQADNFYGILHKWRDALWIEWAKLVKKEGK